MATVRVVSSSMNLRIGLVGCLADVVDVGDERWGLIDGDAQALD